MRNIFLFLFIATLLSCSVTKKYSYKFDYHKYQRTIDLPSLPKVNPTDLTADVSVAGTNRIEEQIPTKSIGASKSKAKTIRQELKTTVKELRKEFKPRITLRRGQSDKPTSEKMGGINLLGLILATAGGVLSILGMWAIGLLLCLAALLIILLGNKHSGENQSSSEVKPSPDNQAEPKKPGHNRNGLAIAGFVCSLVGLFLWPISLVGIILSAIGLKSQRHGLALAGLIIGIVGLVVALALLATLSV